MEFNFSGFLGAVIAVVQKRMQEEKDMLLKASLSSEAPPTPSSTEPRSSESEALDAENPSQGAPAAPADPSHLAFGDTERRTMAVEVMRLLFENLGSRAIMALQEEQRGAAQAATKPITITRTLVVSGGVASNGFLRHVLRCMLDVRGFGHVEVVAPPPRFCTDNAAMIAWAGIEMYEQGWTTDDGVLALKDWAVDPDGPDGGILGAPGWIGPGKEEG
ncbi:glycoprotease pgp1 [Magnaporthiopsis poae ATCC 64411]|uniref:Glycoprotease pgp1 n=1 Tax=Magnaporthiopsis poae (strain ATCC 64411 / 73-15) TaxID=644358 RepID=A0A0C4DTA7_MAGP6|nr:glycoprotease pgp1 [Magnaporthiopsis poae ATCC 64411]